MDVAEQDAYRREIRRVISGIFTPLEEDVITARIVEWDAAHPVVTAEDRINAWLRLCQVPMPWPAHAP